MAGGGSPTHWGSAIPTSSNSLTPHPGNTLSIPRSHNPSDGHADIAAHPGEHGEHSAISNVAQFSPADPHQGTIPDHVLHIPEQFDDAPYVPPRVTQAELQTYSALDPRISNVYPAPNHDVQQRYLYDGGTSPPESHHSIESHWSNSSSSSASSQRLSHDSLVEPAYAQVPPPRLPTSPHYYPAHQGQHPSGFEHLQHAEPPSNTGGPYYPSPPQGYSIDGLLSPEIFEDASTQAAMPFQVNHPSISSQESRSSSSSISVTNQHLNISTFPASPTIVTGSTQSVFCDAGPYLRQQLGLPAHAPVSLHSLPDPPPGEKPSTPLPMLVKLAIYGSPNKKLTLQEIYTELENRFQWFRDHKNEKAWKNSIRHNLSLNKVFKRVPRPITEPGKGSYWRLDISGGEGYKRDRKRRPKNKAIVSEEEEDEASEMDEDPQSPSDLPLHGGIGRSSLTPVEDAHIDPELRIEGHVVGEGRTRSTTRRTGGGNPYPSQSSRYQQGPLPVVMGQDAGTPGQPLVHFGQPTFGQSSFSFFPQTRAMPAASSSFASLSSSPMTMVPATSTVACSQPQHAASHDHTAQALQPSSGPGIEYVVDAGGLLAARRVRTYPESQEQSQSGGVCSSLESSSGSPRTWDNTRSRC